VKWLRGAVFRGLLLEDTGSGAFAGVGPADHLIEGVANFELREVAVAFAIDDLLNEVFLCSRGLDHTIVELELIELDDGVVDGVEGEHGATDVPIGCVVAHEIGACLRRSGVAFHFLVEFEIAGAAGWVGAVVDVVAIVEGIAAAAALHVADDEGPVCDVVGEVEVGVEAGEIAHEGCGCGVAAEGGEDFVAVRDGIFKVCGNGDEGRHDVGEVEVECGAHGEAMAEGFVGGTDGAAEVEAAEVGFGVELEGDGDELAAHGAAGDVSFERLAVLADEVAAEGFGFWVSLFECPAGFRVGTLCDSVAAFEEGLLLAGEALGDVEGCWPESVAVIEDDERVVPVSGDVDAVFGAIEHANFGEACGGLKNLCVGGFLYG